MVKRADLTEEQTQILNTRLAAKPTWLQDLSTHWKNGKRVFLLHFNVHDLVFDAAHEPASLNDLLHVGDFLKLQMWLNMDSAVSYSLTSGLQAHPGWALPSDATQGGAPGQVERLGGIDRVKTFGFDPRQQESLETWRQIVDWASGSPFELYQRQGQYYQPIPNPPYSERHPAQACRLLTRILEAELLCADGEGQEQGNRIKRLSIGMVVDHTEHILPATDGMARTEVSELVEAVLAWSRSREVRNSPHLVVFLASNLHAVAEELYNADSKVQIIRLDRPSLDQRHAFLDWLARQPEFAALDPPLQVDVLANKTAGLNYAELLAMARQLARDKAGWEAAVKVRKDEVIRRESGGLLVPCESPWKLDDVAGYEYAKEPLNQILAQLRETGQSTTPGILFAGPPGTGKSFMAQALANSAGMNMVRFGNILGMYVGQSERNLDRALEVTTALHPVIVFIDEIDQAYGRRQGQSGDSGVSQRIFGRLLSFMDDKANLGKVLWIAATNRPDLMDDALLSRFRVVIPFLLPDRATCIKLLDESLPKQHEFRWKDGPVAAELIGGLVGKSSGRELDAIVGEVRRRTYPSEVVPLARLYEVIEASRVAHNTDVYTFQALLAVQRVLFPSRELIAGIQEVLEPAVNRPLVRDGRIQDDILESLVHDYQMRAGPYLR